VEIAVKKPSTFLLLLLLLLFSKHARAQQQPAFQSEEITFKSNGDVSLSGTLTIPNGTGPYPAIVLLGGSERMSRVAMYKWSNADSIVSQGIAVFSFDSPGVGKSEGSRWKRTTHERTEDALAAIRAIEKSTDINKEAIGLYGASEGGLVVFRAASRSKNIAFGVATSAPAVPYFKHIYSHVRTMCAATGLKGIQLEKLVMFNRLLGYLIREHDLSESEELAKTVAEWHDPIWSQLISLLKNRTKDNRKATRESFIAIAENWEGEEWFRGNKTVRELLMKLQGIDISKLGKLDSVRSYLDFDSAMLAKVAETDTPLAMTAVNDASRDEDPVTFLREITCPMLCIYGEKDQEMLEYPGIVQKAFADAGHDDFVVKILQGAGHQLEITNGKQTYRDKSVDQFILDWLQKRVQKAQ
jgi:alpha-beta hydrolase superfamily lysophospholipase